MLRNLDPAETAKMVEDGVARIQAAGADLVLVDPQYSPRVTERAESASQMIKLLGRVADLRHVGIFPRFEVMREWHENQALPIDSFVIADGLHMNDWGYACFAQLLGDDIIKSVGQIKLGVNVQSRVRAYRPPSLIDRLSTTVLAPAAFLAIFNAWRKSQSEKTNPCNTTAPFSIDTVTCLS